MISLYNLIYYLQHILLFIYDQLKYYNKMSQSNISTSTKPKDDKDDVIKWKNQFNMEMLKSRNDSCNNPLFTSDRYEQTITTILGAKEKCFADRTKKEIALLKTYDIVNFGEHPKLVKKKTSTDDNLTKYYVSFNELFDVIYEVHTTLGHRGINNTMKELKKKYANVTEKQVTLFLSGCEECKRKRSKSKNSCKLVVQPVQSNDFNARGQVDLVDM